MAIKQAESWLSLRTDACFSNTAKSIFLLENLSRCELGLLSRSDGEFKIVCLRTDWEATFHPSLPAFSFHRGTAQSKLLLPLLSCHCGAAAAHLFVPSGCRLLKHISYSCSGWVCLFGFARNPYKANAFINAADVQNTERGNHTREK